MNILILSGSPRKGGNTDLLVEAFVKGASQKHHVEVVFVHDYKVNPCLGCNACFMSKDNTCAQKDDMAMIYEKDGTCRHARGSLACIFLWTECTSEGRH